jgi:hypothetical protein
MSIKEVDDQPGLFVYLNTGNGFDNGKQWQSSLGGDYNWKNRPMYENGEHSMLMSPFMSINIEFSPFAFVGRFFQLSPRLACHCLPLSKPSPVLR